MNKKKPSCFGCIHHAYNGPAGVLPDEEVKDEDGVYKCRLFSEILCRADETPRPLLSACKETR